MSDELEPTGHTIFCDDIRLEHSGQISLVGVYTAGIVIHTPFPATLPRFAFFIEFDEPRELAEKRDFTAILNIYLPGNAEPFYRHEIPPPLKQHLDALWQQHLPLLELAKDDKAISRVTALLNLTMAPLLLSESGLIRVRVSYKDKIIRCGTFKVFAAPDVSPTNAAQQTELGQSTS